MATPWMAEVALVTKADHKPLGEVDVSVFGESWQGAAISGATLPPPVATFLKQNWLGLLARNHAGQGPEGAPWRQSVASMQELVWSLKPKADPDERAKLQAALPMLLRRIAAGMDAMDMSPADRKPVLDALMAAHREILRPK